MASYFTVNNSEFEFRNRIDAELYQPNLRSSLRSLKISGYVLKKLSSLFIIRSGTTPPDRKDGLIYGPILLKTTDIRNEVLPYDGDYYHIEEHIHRRMQITKLQQKDVLLNIVGATLEVIGRTAFLDELPEEANITQAMVFLRAKSSEIVPGFLFVYLCSSFAKDQIKRFARPTGQYNLNLQEVGQILIPICPNHFQQEIDLLVMRSAKLLKDADESYSEAQQLLETELGLDRLNLQKPVGYTARFSEIVSNNRIDADFYQIPFRQIHQHLDKFKTERLCQLAQLKKGIEVGSKAYSDSGHLFLRVGNVKEKQIEVNTSDKFISDTLFQNLIAYQPQKGELLLTKDGSPGICYVVDQEIDGIVSGGILRLLLSNESIPAEYLALVINSKVCRMQVEQDCSGALILHWKPSSVRNLRIPLLHDDIMCEIANLVIASKQAKLESERLLDKAKTRVEQMIEEAVQHETLA